MYFKTPLWTMSVFLLKNIYIHIFVIRLLIYNQFQILNLINFIICYMCPKKEHFAKMGIAIQKVNHLSVHSPCFNCDKNLGVFLILCSMFLNMLSWCVLFFCNKFIFYFALYFLFVNMVLELKFFNEKLFKNLKLKGSNYSIGVY